VAKARPIGSKPARRSTRPKLVHQFLIVLSGTDPLVWRRIQVPEKYSFWDLHVATQDAMGWLDYHLHEFRLLDQTEKHVVSIGGGPSQIGCIVLVQAVFFLPEQWIPQPADWASRNLRYKRYDLSVGEGALLVA